MSLFCSSCQVLMAVAMLLSVVEAAAWGVPSPAVRDADDTLRRDIEEGLLLPRVPETPDQQKLAPMPYVEASQFRKTAFNSTASSGPVKKYRPGIGKLRVLKNQDPHLKPRKTVTTTTKILEETPIPKEPAPIYANHPPPIWSHDVIADELSDPFGRLPSNEEYDRNTRFTHSILYGYHSGF